MKHSDPAKPEEKSSDAGPAPERGSGKADPPEKRPSKARHDRWERFCYTSPDEIVFVPRKDEPGT